MGDKTAIEWTDATWNPVRGCSRVSEGCRNCYAEKVAARFSGPGLPYEGVSRNGKWTGKTVMVPAALEQPLRWKRPRRIFVNSMSDLFHETMPMENIARVFMVMAAAPQHTFQVLTKRPARMLEFFEWCKAAVPIDCPKHWPLPKVMEWPLPNVWIGVSVENQAAADERIPLLLETPAVVRFLSCEPLLGPVDISLWLHHGPFQGIRRSGKIARVPGLDWVIVGGESGHGSRPMHPEWALDLRDQCAAASVAFYFKQWGEWVPGWEAEAAPRSMSHFHSWPDGSSSVNVGKRSAGRTLDGKTHSEFPRVVCND